VLKGGGGSISGGVWAGSKAVISTSVGRVKVFEGQEEMASFGAHAGEVSAVALHPSGDMAASVGVDKSYVLYDLSASSVATQVYSDSGMSPMGRFVILLIMVNSSHLRTIPS
jgi:pre-mRNA-processing factor 19